MANIIKQLPTSVADQISAGEVIERPASVVKELIENSIDAGSDRILVEVQEGGKEGIRIKDNGCGIKAEEIELAFSRYATSKIDDINDLYSLRTLGFRGEALASIASVSRVEITSRHQEQIKAVKLMIKGGRVREKETVGGPVGTDIEVKDLFYNTPARFKYLKTTSTEFAHISTAVCNQTLAYPGISFLFKHNDRQILKTPGSKKLEDAIMAVYGQELISALNEISFKDRFIEVKGFIARPTFSRSSRIYEKFFVNQRSVYSQELSRAVEEAYGGLLASGKYPVVFLNIDLNPILVDVNVHPTKKEIKFSRNEVIKDVLKKGIKNRLKEIDSFTKMKIPTGKSTSKEKDQRKKFSFKKKIKTDQKIAKKTEDTEQKPSDEKQFHSYQTKNTTVENEGKPVGKIEKNEKNLKEDELNQENYQVDHPVKNVLGQIENTYIIVEAQDGLFIVDQHAARERILYEAFLKKYNNGQISKQQLLTPVNLELTIAEMEIIEKYSEQLSKTGFKVEEFGTNSIIIQEVPAIIKNRSSKQVIREVIDFLIENGTAMEPADLISEFIIYLSCRTAIKAGDRLNMAEQQQIIQDLFATENPYRCPHGRPAILHLDNKELEKGLQRR